MLEGSQRVASRGFDENAFTGRHVHYRNIGYFTMLHSGVLFGYLLCSVVFTYRTLILWTVLCCIV